MIFRKEEVSDAEVKKLMADEAELSEEKIKRKKWCVEQAMYAFDDNASVQQVIAMAEAIYTWIYGERP